MERTILLTFLLLFIAQHVNAQAQEDTSRIFKNHSLQFRVSQNFTLSSFTGGLISYKYHFNDKNAFRIGFGIGLSSGEEETGTKTMSTDTTKFFQKSDFRSSETEIVAEYIRYLIPDKEIKIFLGMGPRFMFSRNEITNDKIDTLGIQPGSGYVDKREYENYEIGLSFGLGVEWFFLNYMSLHAEYGANLYYFKNYRYTRNVYLNYAGPRERYSEGEEKTTGMEIRDRGVLFGLSVYF